MPFSVERATKAIRFFERVLVHVDGEWAGKPFTLMDWQRDLISRLFGTLREDGMRQYRTCYVEVPRKNGKSELAAGIALYLLFADGEDGAQVYGAASDRDQAGIVYRVASEMVRRASVLDKRAKRIDSMKRMTVPASASFYRAIPADAGGAHGFNASGVIVDEVHVQPNRDLIDVLNTSTGARRQPLTFYITTSGYDRNSICYELHDYALRVQKGSIEDDTFLPVVYFAEETDDWKDPTTWAKANPSLGVTIKRDYLERECQRAQETPAYENTFRRLHLDQWTQQETRWLSLEKWDACADPIDFDDWQGRECWAGLDLSTTTDITALALLSRAPDGILEVLPHFWIPEERMTEAIKRDGVPYDAWVRRGFVTATPGNVVDYEFIRQKIKDLDVVHPITSLNYDPWNATQLAVQLKEQDGLEVFPLRQGFGSLSEPTKTLETLVLGKQLRHGGNPVLRWMLDCVTVLQDAAGNIKPVKPDRNKTSKRIDGIVALIAAIDRVNRSPEGGRSIYETRGLVSWADLEESEESDDISLVPV